ncbi:ubiquitin-specific protease UBP10 NDAI_0F03410 [Naumovozyma dairenensis CBS 421]|uniref:ubiquitinyl hydrolase 1 n=1 Tax=Naumovozyma dairenensis (strain ATCC 10597 / BCRC 20456 / CBS 421 / NBRC 0211 / NRRL Y-12639) TaxID=1071378 RepID=G0WCZ8_NAUDC|nr:hypothetical protein NDAI_0F03410 [Naumovozyma dairenensis CBS 421]CCD25659.1 hypothetical protein NDAI_0F03410 [Naumovozyma dairenensis CBS 421]
MNSRETLKPLVDRILNNPLQFKEASFASTSNFKNNNNTEKASYIMIGTKKNHTNTSIDTSKKNKGNTNTSKSGNNNKKLKEQVKPKSMAEALHLYTTSSSTSTSASASDLTTSLPDSKRSTVTFNDTASEDDSDNAYNDSSSSSSSSNSDAPHSISKVIQTNTANNTDNNVSNESSPPDSKDEVYYEAKEYPTKIDQLASEISSELSAQENSSNEEEEEDLGIPIDINFNSNDDDGSSSMKKTLDLNVQISSSSSPASLPASTIVSTSSSPSQSESPDNSTSDNDNDDDADDDSVDQDFKIGENTKASIDENDSDDDDDSEDLEIDSISDSEKIQLQEENEQYMNSIQDKKQNNILEESRVEDEDEDEDDSDEEDGHTLRHKTPSSKKSLSTPPSEKECKSTPATNLQDFYQFNEIITDEGSIIPSNIIKNWGPVFANLRPKGLINHGVTCYTNAAVQAMVHIPAVQHYLFDILRGKYKNIDPNSVSYTLAETTRRMWLSNKKGNKKVIAYYNPNELIERLDDINWSMNPYNQEDSHEYFMSLMSKLQENSVPIGRNMTESIIYDIFGGLLEQTVTCKSCGGVSKTEQEFYDLSLDLNGKRNNPAKDVQQSQEQVQSDHHHSDDGNDAEEDSDNGIAENGKNVQQPNAIIPRSQSPQEIIPKQTKARKYTIEKAIRDFFNPELLKVDKNDKGYVCEKCNKTTNAIKRSTILRAPETLVVHLKKFRFNGSTSSKMKQAVSYPMYLDITEYCESSKKVLPAKYQLLSVVVHEGRSLSSGHYIAHCRQPDGTWATYDDELINKISELKLLTEPNAYYLVYTRLTPRAIPLKDSLPKNKVIDIPLKKKIRTMKIMGRTPIIIIIIIIIILERNF